MRHLALFLCALCVILLNSCGTTETKTDPQVYEWIALQPGTFERLRTFVSENGTPDNEYGFIKYTFPDSMNIVILETENDTPRLTVWSRLSGDTVSLHFLPQIMYEISPNDSWTGLIVDDAKQELAIRPIVDGMLAEIDD